MIKLQPSTTQSENEILDRWAEYCSDLSNFEIDRDLIILDCPQIPDEEHHRILREEVETAVKAPKMWKSAGVDNIPAELFQAGGETMIDILTSVCNKIWNIKSEMRSFKSNENIHKKEGGSYYVVSANKASSVTL